MLRVLLLPALAVMLSATPALAANCHALPGSGGISLGLRFSFGEDFTEADRSQFDLMTLRRLGIDATRAERWGGCIRAYVRGPDGRERMEFYNPNTFERVD